MKRDGREHGGQYGLLTVFNLKFLCTYK